MTATLVLDRAMGPVLSVAGAPLDAPVSSGVRSPIGRLMASVVETDGPLTSPCWITNFATSPKGYTRIRVAGRMRMCHRLAYELLVGPIPEGLQIDHLCRVRNCVNPDHLEPVTSRENTLRGESLTAILVRTNTCKNGHSMDDAYIERGGVDKVWRRCRPCRDAYRRQQYLVKVAS